MSLSQEPEARPMGVLLWRQVATVSLLFCGYAAYYFCRADFSVAMPLLVEDLGRRGVPHAEAVVRLGEVYSLGVLAYALGKLFLCGLGDMWGGRRSFLIGLGGAAAFTMLFASGGSLPIFTIAWIGNRLTQSIGWAGLLKVCSRWFHFSHHGAVIGILSLSYFAGDVVARQCMGLLIGLGYDWQTLFRFAALAAGLIFVANYLFLRNSRAELGFAEAEANPLNLYADADAAPLRLRTLLLPLLRSRAFLLVCLLSFGCTVVRETFNIWTPVYLRDAVGYDPAHAASLSAVFPALGFVSVLAAGFVGDRCGPNGRPLLLLGGLAATAASLLGLMLLRLDLVPPWAAVVLVGVVAFCLLGPYSYLGGAFALDFGGHRAGAVASGVIDGVGYLGGALAGDSVARISVAFGWRGVFVVLASVAAASAIAAAALFAHQRRVLRTVRGKRDD
ncbi:MAG: MFS transporter [Proteobacteria bacterium]|nr:MFS transporter [Pseudomonadota bacterium]